MEIQRFKIVENDPDTTLKVWKKQLEYIQTIENPIFSSSIVGKIDSSSILFSHSTTISPLDTTISGTTSLAVDVAKHTDLLITRDRLNDVIARLKQLGIFI